MEKLQQGRSLNRRRELLAGVAAGDMAVFLLFPLLGSRNHEEAYSAELFLRNAFPFAAGWFLLGPFLRTLRAATLLSPRKAMLTVAAAWPLCGLAGLVLRTLLFDRPWLWSFVIVSLLAQGLMLLAWRVIFARFARPL